jgi:hypothetical protein
MLNNSQSTTSNRIRLSSKDRKESMKRLGIASNLSNRSKVKECTVEQEKKKIQEFLDAFFQNDVNGKKFSDAERRKFAANFKKEFINDKIKAPMPKAKKNPAHKLKALPAPPMPPSVNRIEEKEMRKPVNLPSIPKIEEEKKIDDPEGEQKIG